MEILHFAPDNAVSAIMIDCYDLLDDSRIHHLRTFILDCWARGIFVELLMAGHHHVHIENHPSIMDKVEKARDLFIELETADGALNGPLSPYSHCKEVKWAWETPAPTRAMTSSPSLPLVYSEVQRGTVIVNGVTLANEQESANALIQALAQIASISPNQIKVTSRQLRSGLQFQYEIRYETQQEGSYISSSILNASGIGSGLLMSTLSIVLEQGGYSGPVISSVTAHRWCCS